MIELRKGTMEDAEYILKVRNDEDIRYTSGESRIVNKEEHMIWLKQFLTKHHHYYFIGEQNDKPVGMVRFQPYNGQLTKSEISITIYPKLKQKKGLGTALLMAGIEYLKDHTEIKEIVARVLKTNQHSLNFFRKNGFSPYFEDEHFIVFQYAFENVEGIE